MTDDPLTCPLIAAPTGTLDMVKTTTQYTVRDGEPMTRTVHVRTSPWAPIVDDGR